ncbi:MAG: nucleotide pyrophosphohydrolase [Promethearchaeota archaeon]|nr:MAG: nucleotide pyrophosphohydrolase [Candidatus Lokiarchaeota archaeon]
MSIREFQDLMKDLYFPKDKHRGISDTFIWLVEEVGELATELNKGRNKKNISEEMADIFAWMCSLANLLDIDLDQAVFEKYPKKCPKCGSNPCQCD